MSTTAKELDDATIMTMMRNPRYTTAFPFLTSTISAPKCGTCGGSGRAKPRRVVDFNGLRAKLAGMSRDDKAQLKKLLGAQQVVIRYRKPNGQSHKVIVS